MKIDIAEARNLMEQALRKTNFSDADAKIIADHLLDCELRGISMGGISRALTIFEMFGDQAVERDPISIIKETPYSASFEAGDNIGYLLGHRATSTAISKATETGIGIVTGHCAIFSGMLSYYAEMVTRQGYVCITTSSAGPMVAPEGGTEARFGTNPVAFGFPSKGDPVIWDIGTSKIMMADAVLARRLGHQLAEDVAYAPDGTPTTDPQEALDGAIRVWGGHKGSGLALSVQLMGLLAGADPLAKRYGGIGFFLLAIDPELLTSRDQFLSDVEKFCDLMRQTRAADPGRKVRLPFDRSRALRQTLLAAGEIDVAEEVLTQLRKIAC